MGRVMTWLRRGLCGAGLLAFGLVFLELCLRLGNPQVIEPRNTTGTPWGVRGNMPGLTYYHQTPFGPIRFRINHQGMRADYDYPEAPAPGVCRIEVYGDSFLMGYEVQEPDTFAQQLGAALKARGLDVEVLNLSVSGFGQAEMLLTYEAQGRRFHPSVVVASWHYTDLDDNPRSQLFKLTREGLARNQPTYMPSVDLQRGLSGNRLYTWLSENSQLWSYGREHLGYQVRKLLAAVRKGDAAEPDAAVGEGTGQGAPDSQAKALSQALLTEFDGKVRGDGAAFVVVAIPKHPSRDVYEPASELLPAPFWSKFDLVEPTPMLKKAASGGKVFNDRGGAMHFTPRGNRLVAALTAEHLVTSPALQRCRALPSAGARQARLERGFAVGHALNEAD